MDTTNEFKKQGEKAMEVEISEKDFASKKEYWDFYSSMTTSYNKGRAEGRSEERLANAKALLDNDIPLEVIVKSLHLTEEEIIALKR